ncbi:MAG: hypothetical protein R2734_15380 [Nocardioides sp.]
MDQLQKYGLLTKDNKTDKSPDEVKMSDKDAQASAEVFVGCIDAGKMITDAMGSSMPAEVTDCIDKALTDDVLTKLFASMFRGEDAQQVSQELLAQPLTECMTGG